MRNTLSRTATTTALLIALAGGGVVAASAASANDSTSRPAASTFTMPKVVGMVLQDAQDLLQSKGSYLMDQVDAKGWDRWQILDSGWKVCWQKPAPGTKVSKSAVITLGSVKLGESCPR